MWLTHLALAGHLNLRRLQIGTKFIAGLNKNSRAIALKVTLPAGQCQQQI